MLLEHRIGGRGTINRKCGLKRFSRSRKNAKVACFREVVAQEWDGQLDLKVVLAGAGGYALREHMSLKGKGGWEGGEKSISEEHIIVT